jgi:hypothetical protein
MKLDEAKEILNENGYIVEDTQNVEALKDAAYSAVRAYVRALIDEKYGADKASTMWTPRAKKYISDAIDSELERIGASALDIISGEEYGIK